MRERHFVSPEAPGFHTVVSPERNGNRAVYVMRLNLSPGEVYTLETGALEMNALLIRGAARCPLLEGTMKKKDSFYLPGKSALKLEAGAEGASFYIGGAVCAGIGRPFARAFDPLLPLGEVHQIHGKGSGTREVFFTLEESVPASRLICGVTTGGDGAWTSWPPHQHEKFLEEAYCYYDMPAPMTGFQLYYGTSETIDDARVYPVRDGHVVVADDGYHPTVAVPGTRNSYFWVLAAFEPEGRSYKKAVEDPLLGGKV